METFGMKIRHLSKNTAFEHKNVHNYISDPVFDFDLIFLLQGTFLLILITCHSLS